MRITNYNITTDKICSKIKLACVSDTHGRRCDKVIDTLKDINPDYILLAGDILEVFNEYMAKRNKNAFEFLEKISNIAPIYYCFGNHEIYYSHSKKEKNRISNEAILKDNTEKLKKLGIHIVNDSFEKVALYSGEQISIGGLVCGRDMNPALKKDTPDLDFLAAYNDEDSFKILLCHYPHYYKEYLSDKSFDLILSGHAHGGQWRLFNRGVYAPHQGIFPKYTSGIFDGRFIISRGAVNNSKPIPRFFNPTEILRINIMCK